MLCIDLFAGRGVWERDLPNLASEIAVSVEKEQKECETLFSASYITRFSTAEIRYLREISVR